MRSLARFVAGAGVGGSRGPRMAMSARSARLSVFVLGSVRTDRPAVPRGFPLVQPKSGHAH
jgi:hypothetical protein